MMFGVLIILSIILVTISFLLLSIKMVFSKHIIKRKETFPDTSIGGNKNMRKAGIICPKQYDRIDRKKVLNEMKTGTCSSCSIDSDCD